MWGVGSCISASLVYVKAWIPMVRGDEVMPQIEPGTPGCINVLSIIFLALVDYVK